MHRYYHHPARRRAESRQAIKPQHHTTITYCISFLAAYHAISSTKKINKSGDVVVEGDEQEADAPLLSGGHRIDVCRVFGWLQVGNIDHSKTAGDKAFRIHDLILDSSA